MEQEWVQVLGLEWALVRVQEMAPERVLALVLELVQVMGLG